MNADPVTPEFKSLVGELMSEYHLLLWGLLGLLIFWFVLGGGEMIKGWYSKMFPPKVSSRDYVYMYEPKGLRDARSRQQVEWEQNMMKQKELEEEKARRRQEMNESAAGLSNSPSTSPSHSFSPSKPGLHLRTRVDSS